MYGPKPLGFWSKHSSAPWGPLQTGSRYRVTRGFTDFDGVDHPVGEEWRFLGSNYSPYDSGLSLFVSLDGDQEWHIRLQDAPGAQGELLRELDAHVVALET